MQHCTQLTPAQGMPFVIALAGAASSLLADLIVKTSAAARLRYPVPTADRLLQAAGLLL